VEFRYADPPEAGFHRARSLGFHRFQHSIIPDAERNEAKFSSG
jgi:hypothetical protein